MKIIIILLLPLLVHCAETVESVSGHIYDLKRSPVKDALVTYSWYGDDTVLSDENGFYYIEQSSFVVLLKPGFPTLSVEKEGYVTERIDSFDIEGSDNVIDFYLTEE